jgi:cytoskeletal protein CcmA (bactofilin family)
LIILANSTPLVHWKKSPAALFRTSASLPAAKGATFAACLIILLRFSPAVGDAKLVTVPLGRIGYLDRMSEPKRRFLERAASPTALPASPTVIGADTVFVGNIRGKGHFIVSGEIHGDGELEGALHLAVTANWHGTVHADQAIVAGKITGGLIVRDKLEIGYTAVIRGRVSARTIAIAKGAIVDGQIEVTSGTPVVEFEEKREGR